MQAMKGSALALAAMLIAGGNESGLGLQGQVNRAVLGAVFAGFR